ncbi:lipoamide dehydrogenase, E3 component is part of three enzyme complexes [Nitrospira japonica]|uniref:Dihydrolipoyl dehydrogenase n=1 Tax=Nitrospira japonica TaxID=1325564 RepID=A0A1W1I8Q3_9BACT|nr:dihydrolipoyl dehydrogenase [Nitrospira japonica]SLM49397.1 lipoamide dehydrogenase, E3 component is part of three enzyme complexes [Nitrospira japonica]
MAETECDVVVIGAGPGGYAAAFQAADLGLRTVVVDQEAQPGGVCLLRGCIPSKALLHAARVISEAEDARAWGIEFDKPRVDLETLRRRVKTIIAKLTKGVQALAGSRKVELIQARATFKDKTTLSLNGSGGSRELTFAHAILATGSRPVVPGSLAIDDPRVMDSTGALDLPDVPARLLVVGGGYIGLELGTVYHALRSEVTVVEALPRLLNGADLDLIRPLQQRMERRFKAIKLETKVDKLESRKDGIAATLAGSGGSTTEVFDRVLVAVGRRPNTEQLGLETTKVALTAKGFVQVDRQLRTAEPAIFAIGDVAGEPMLAHKATHEGLIAARVIAGQQTAFDATAVPAVVFTDPEIAWCGLTEEAAKAAGQAVTVTKFPWLASGRATTLGRNDGLTKLILDKESGRVLGVGICGVGAGELIAEGVLAVEMGAVAEDVAASIHPHPTLSETVMEAAEAFHGYPTHLYSKR